MRSLSSSMLITFRTSTIGLGISEARGASTEGQRPQQAGFQRRAQRVALQQEDEPGGHHGVQGHIAPVLHRPDPPRFAHYAATPHVTSFTLVWPPTGAEN